MKNSAQVRQAGLDDLQDLSILFEEYRCFYEQKPLEKNHLIEFLSNLLNNREIAVLHVLAVDDKIVGFSTLYFSFSSVRAQKIAILNDLYVCKEHRRFGQGRILFRETHKFVKQNGFSVMKLETAHTNAPAQKLYESEGGTLSDFNTYVWSTGKS